MGFLRRNLKRCPPACKQQAYTSLVRPLLEYGAVVWDPYLKKNIDSMEKTQRIAARFITGDFRSNTPGSVTRLLERTGLPPLQLRRQHLRLTLFCRVVEGLVPALPPHQFLTPQKQGRLIRTVRKDDFQVTNIIRCTPMCHRRTKELIFCVRATADWNQTMTPSTART